MKVPIILALAVSMVKAELYFKPLLEVPVGCTYWDNGSAGESSGELSSTLLRADDFIVSGDATEITALVFEVNSTTMSGAGDELDLMFYYNNIDNTPGIPVTSVKFKPFVTEHLGGDIAEVFAELEAPINLSPGTYWMEPRFPHQTLHQEWLLSNSRGNGGAEYSLDHDKWTSTGNDLAFQLVLCKPSQSNEALPTMDLARSLPTVAPSLSIQEGDSFCRMRGSQCSD